VPERQCGATRTGRWAAAILVPAMLSGCLFSPTPTPTPEVTASPTASPVATASPTATGASPSVEPTATPEPPLSLPIPSRHNARQLAVSVAPNVAADGGGEIVVTVRNLTGRRIPELVLRWATELKQALFLAPFRPSQQRIANGGPPLHQDWTKWVEGPGEQGEPAGTTSLGWGPLLPNARLTIPIQVTRNAPGAVSFDLQLLTGEVILSLDDGSPAELRVTVR